MSLWTCMSITSKHWAKNPNPNMRCMTRMILKRKILMRDLKGITRDLSSLLFPNRQDIGKKENPRELKTIENWKRNFSKSLLSRVIWNLPQKILSIWINQNKKKVMNNNCHQVMNPIRCKKKKKREKNQKQKK